MRERWFAISKFILIGLGSIVAAVLMMGVIYSEQTQSFEIRVAKPSYKCFQIFSDPLTLPRWIVGLKDIKLLEGNLDQPGCKILLVMEAEGKQMEMTQTLVNFEENKLYGFNYNNEMLTGYLETKFEADGNTTRIIVTHRYSGNNLLKNVWAHFMTPVIAETQKQQYDRLKVVIEESQW